MLLAIDTATQTLSLGLHDARSLLAEQTWKTDNNHSIELAPAVRDLLRRHSLTMMQITGLAVCIGPGTYTGLRVGVSFAKGLAAARRLPLIGMTTLDILAAAQPPAARTTLMALATAGRGRVVAGTYTWRKERWTATGEARLLTWDELFASIDGNTLLTGELDDDAYAAYSAAQTHGVPVTLAASALRLRRAGFLAQEAALRLYGDAHSVSQQVALADAHPADQVMPIYVKTKDTP